NGSAVWLPFLLSGVPVLPLHFFSSAARSINSAVRRYLAIPQAFFGRTSRSEN
ncbi:MAG: hypothetical protein ACI9ZF_003643, partial [Bradyrhizobium sp.]